MKWSSGSGDIPSQLGANGAFVKKKYAKDHSPAVRSPLRVKTPTGAILRLHVVGIFDEPKGGSPFGEVSISTAAFDRSFANRDNEFTLLNVAGGPSPAATARIEHSLTGFPDSKVQTRDEFRNSQI